jgi:hypothetical protein
MSTQQVNGVSTLDERKDLLVRSLNQLVGQETDSHALTAKLTEESALLESLPPSTAEFGVATNRLRSVFRYLESGECGAARYELRMLTRGLTSEPAGRPLRRRIRHDVH